MGNVETLYGFKSQLSRSRIEIVMADIDEDDNGEVGNNNKSNLVLSNHSLSSILSFTSATQTEPELFTKWPKRRFMFNWLNKLKNYHSLLSKSQQLLSSNMFLHSKNDNFYKRAEVKTISLSTQTVNEIAGDCQISNMFHLELKAKVLSVTSLKSEMSDKSTNEETKIFENLEENLENDLAIEQDLVKATSAENDQLESGPLFKKPKLQKTSSKITNDIMISQLSNKFYRSEIFKPAHYSDAMLESMDSLTSVTVLSKPDNKSLIFQSKTNPISYSYNGNRDGKHRSKSKSQNYIKSNFNDIKISTFNGINDVQVGKNKKRKRSQKSLKLATKPNSLPGKLQSQSGNSMNEISVKNSSFQDTGKVQILSYRFWITASGKNWEVFHNPTDRRIESIGRIAKCRIQLTNYITRHSDGLLKQQVIVYAPTQSSLEKCCRLFDDKFPEFYASSGLLKVLYFRKNSSWTEFWDNYKNILQVDLPLSKRGVKRQTKRKRSALVKAKQINELSFLRNQLIKN